MKSRSLLLLTSCLVLCSCGNTFTKHKTIRINMSETTKAFYDAIGFSNRNEMNEQNWPLTEAWILSRESGYIAMPTEKVDSEGKTVSLIEHSVYNKRWNDIDFVSSFTPSDGEYDRVILYVHGGAYVYGAYPQHTILCDNYSNDNNALVIAPNYPLAPEYNYVAAYEMLDEIYNSISKLNKPLIFAGDSAGGGLITAYTLYLKENDKRLPNKMMLSSPWLDVSLSNPDIPKYQELDHMLHQYGLIQMGKWWAGEQPTTSKDKISVTDYRISPMFGDFSNFPETLLFGSNCEIFYPDFCKFLNILDKKKVKSSFVEMNGFGHVSNLYNNLSEYGQLLGIVEDFLKQPM